MWAKILWTPNTPHPDIRFYAFLKNIRIRSLSWGSTIYTSTIVNTLTGSTASLTSRWKTMWDILERPHVINNCICLTMKRIITWSGIHLFTYSTRVDVHYSMTLYNMVTFEIFRTFDAGATSDWVDLGIQVISYTYLSHQEV